MEKLSNFRKKCINENNEVREFGEQELMKIKIRKCNYCNKDFESASYYSCRKCRLKKREICCLQ